MTGQAPNGLAALSAQRERAKRAMPTPRHPIANDAEINQVPEAMEDPTATPDPRSSNVQKAMPNHQAPGGVANATFKVTLYVDRATDDFMEATRVEGLTARPKVDVSRSAVVRLALRRLMDEMSPAEVKSLLEAQPVRPGGPGRKRR